MDNSIIRVLGIDPGYDRLGFACVKGVATDLRSAELVDVGIISSTKQNSFNARFLEINNDLKTLFTKLKPDVVVIEKVVATSRSQVLLRIAEVIGAVKAVAVDTSSEILEVYPSTLKRFITGDGRASKSKIRKYIHAQFSLDITGVVDDSLDALAVALYGLINTKL